jgi:DNA-binding CsgD family transcriptional regulator
VDAPSLLERERELGLIDERLDDAVRGRGGLLLIEGPAGIGKSALVERARAAALERNVAVAVARAAEMERADAFGVVRQLFEPRLRAMSPAARERALAGAAALAAPVVLPETEVAPGGDGSSFATLHGLYWLLMGMAAERPQLLAVDDVHWADEASVRFLRFLANRLAESPVAVLAAQRDDPAAASRALHAAPGAVVVAPGALSVAGTAAALGGEPDAIAPAFAAACRDATGGNPLLVRRLGSGLRERGVPFTDAGVPEIGRLGGDVIGGAVDAALARLGPRAAGVARAVAVLGGDAPLTVVAALAETDRDAAAEAADRLVRAGVLEDGRPLRFQHALVRDAVLGGLTAGARAEAHRRAAELLAAAGAPAPVVATHLLRTEPRGDPATAAALAAEGRRALAAGAPAEARALLGRALAEPPREGDRHALLLDLARATQHLGEPGAGAYVRAAYDAAPDEAGRARAALAVMWTANPTPEEVAAGLELIEPALAGIAGRDRELELQLEAARLFMVFLSPELLMDELGQAERHSGLEGATVGECLLLFHVGLHRYLGGRPAGAIAEPAERIAANENVIAAVGPDAPWLPFLIGTLYKTHRLDGARRVTEIAALEATRIGSAAGFAIASVWRAWIALRGGDAETAEAHARAACDGAPPGSWQRAFCAAGLAEVLVERAQLDEAQAILDGETPGGVVPDDAASDLLVSARPLVRAARGDFAGALADQRAARRRQGEVAAFDLDFDGWVRTARLLALAGEMEEARREAAAALEWARGFGAPGYVGQALTVTGLLEGGAAGLEQLREAVALLERSPCRRELATSLIELGGALRRDGRRVEAREPLRRALDLAAAGGLTATGERAREELRATGARVRRDHATGVASLTPSERRIAERAAAGASNPEIAQALFVTTKTVEMHLSRVYRKLDVQGRGDLAALLAPEVPGAMTGSSPSRAAAR